MAKSNYLRYSKNVEDWAIRREITKIILPLNERCGKMKEIWKDINLIPFNETHIISNYGRIKVKKTGRLIKQRFDKDGYYQVNLYCKGLEKTKKVHRLVALTFVDGYKEGLVVNHIDGIKTNNFAENLEWTTISGNTQHAFDNGLEKKGVKHCNAKHYVLYDEKGNIFSQYENTFILEELTNKSRDVLNRNLKENLYEINNIDYNLPVNKKLNSTKEKLITPIALYDDNFNIIGLYSNSQSLQRNTTITRGIIPKLKYNDFYKYKKCGKKYKKIYYLKKISYINFLTTKCSVIDDKLVIE